MSLEQFGKTFDRSKEHYIFDIVKRDAITAGHKVNRLFQKKNHHELKEPKVVETVRLEM